MGSNHRRSPSYILKQTYPKIFTVIVENNYDRAMLFCRTQEFYESQEEKFKNKKFSFWEYHEWYSKNHNNCFSYPADWSGFNFPLETALKCQKTNKPETPYDLLMKKILSQIKVKNSYIIGVKSLKSSTYQHEICHGFYYTNQEYKKEMQNLTESLNQSCYKNLKSNLMDLGYHKNVIDDEIQAYLSTGADERITKGVKNKEKLFKKYKKIFSKYKIDLLPKS